MAIPKFHEIMLPILKAVASSEDETNVSQLMPSLSIFFSLTDAELAKRLPSGKQTTFANRCHWAVSYLSAAGLLERTRRGFFKISSDGRALLSQNPAALNKAALMQFPKFAAWSNTTPDQATEEGTSDGIQIAATATPDEQIENAAKQLNAALESEVLARVRTVEPTQFEQIVVDLLISMGFGSGDPQMGARVGRSGDGGIDGVIQGDALGLDAVYIQAKRYQDGNTVGSPQLHSFIGSLVGQRASKGVFVTTSEFTREAREYVKTVQHRVVLVNGPELARLLVRHGVGVREDRKIIVKKLDEDYFSDE